MKANLKFYFRNDDLVINLDTIQMRERISKIEFTQTV